MNKKTWIPAVVLLAAAGIITGVLLSGNVRREAVYREASEKLEAGDTGEAWRLFTSLGSWRDARSRADKLEEADLTLPYRAAEEGDIVTFGRWEQDNDESNGPEEIEWIVLDRIEGRLLLLSAACLAGKAYHVVSFEPVTWETCSLRAWLNGEFLSGAFTAEERALIPAVLNENPDHSVVETPGGRDTRDRVFLLCERDTVIYLKSDADRETIGRAYASRAASARGLQTDEEGCASWWLRSPGMYEYIAQFVDREGVPYLNGASTDIDYLCGVRPAIWLDAEGEGQ